MNPTGICFLVLGVASVIMLAASAISVVATTLPHPRPAAACETDLLTPFAGFTR